MIFGSCGVLLAALAGRSLPQGATHPGGLPCSATIGQVTYRLDSAQAANATTVAAVGARLGMPDHAVTIALATALQESKLRNLTYGDRDSVGLFQQRPSQGWGTRDQILTPRYASSAFYGRLTRVPGWQTLSVTQAAQAVQHSAAPEAYAQWEDQARLLARTLTGEVAAGFTCRLTVPRSATLPPALTADLAAELGPPALGAPMGPGRGWTVAAWLVAHAPMYGIGLVRVADRQWTAAAGVWQPQTPVSATVSARPAGR